MNNDVSTFFLDVLPRLAPGVLVGVHDVPLPEDYDPGWAHLYYSELYLLAAMLLVGADQLRPVLASHYVCIRPDLTALLDDTWDAIGLEGLNGYGSALWFETDAWLR